MNPEYQVQTVAPATEVSRGNADPTANQEQPDSQGRGVPPATGVNRDNKVRNKSRAQFHKGLLSAK